MGTRHVHPPAVEEWGLRGLSQFLEIFFIIVDRNLKVSI